MTKDVGDQAVSEDGPPIFREVAKEQGKPPLGTRVRTWEEIRADASRVVTRERRRRKDPGESD